MGLKRLRIGLDGPPVKPGCVVQATLRVGHIARIKERSRVIRMGRQPSRQPGLRRLPIGLGNGCLGRRHLF